MYIYIYIHTHQRLPKRKAAPIGTDLIKYVLVWVRYFHQKSYFQIDYSDV